MAEEAARIRIRRNRAWFGALRRLWVRIDGKKVYRLKYGELATLTVAPGEHTIQVQMDWCKTAPLPVACPKSETIEVECGPGPFWSALPGIVLWPERVFFVGLGRKDSFHVPSVDLLPNFLLFVRDSTSSGCSGYVHHVEREASGCSIETPVAHFVAYMENATENQPKRWELNLFMQRDTQFELAAIPRPLGEWLLAHSACTQPMDLNVHEAKNTDYLSFGDTWFDD